MPWEETGPILVRKCLPCPHCEVKVMVTCLGEHEDSLWPCFLAKKLSCHRPCGRTLACTNHKCKRECHIVENAPDKLGAGSNCQICENTCTFPRPEGCQHSCDRGCHSELCPPCKRLLRLKCHCALNQLYVRCSEWTKPEADTEMMQSCRNQCPKNYECGHRCKAICHSGPCPNPEQCKKKVKIFCACKRIKKEISCESVRNNTVAIECDEVCKLNQEQVKKVREIELEAKRKEEELRNAKELEEYQKKFQGRKKYKEKRRHDETEEKSFLKKYWMFILASFALAFAVYFTTLQI